MGAHRLRRRVVHVDDATHASPSSSNGCCIDNPVPPGSILLTGTGLVPPDSFTLLPGHFVEIHVPEIGTLVNPVVRASELIEKEPVQ